MDFKINKQFEVDGIEVKIISGAIHYWRSHQSTWEDKIIKLKALGGNTVETYVPWNLHEPIEGEIDFSNNLNLPLFIELAQKHELYFILRFSPYICAEHDLGGLPWWLLNKPNIKLRCNNNIYLEAVENYYSNLLPVVEQYLVTNGGNIILGQVENEYGSYGNDKSYLEKLVEITRNNGFDVPLVTSDGSWKNMLESGTLIEHNVLPTVNFGSNANKHFDILQNKYGYDFPLMCMEFWCGWFDAWGSEKPQLSSVKDVATQLAEILKRGSVNFYMFHGGTNFGFMNGANFIDDKYYKPHTTSYDYDALLDEVGNITEKYLACKEVIGKYVNIPEIEITEVKLRDYGYLKYCGSRSLWKTIDNPVYDINTLNMEQFNQGYGYAVYETYLNGIDKIETLMLVGLRDRANVFIDGKRILTTNFYEDGEIRHEINCEVKDGSVLLILVENLGRINYGPQLSNGKKGILNGVFIDAHYHFGWNHYNVNMIEEKIISQKYVEDKLDSAQYHKYELEVYDLDDTYLDMSNFGKGVVFVNGKNIGRYWSIGPQYKLHICNSFFKQGVNEIVVFETEGKTGELKTSSYK